MCVHVNRTMKQFNGSLQMNSPTVSRPLADKGSPYNLQWSGVGRAGAVLGLKGRILLHAGPPFRDPGHMPRPLRNAVIIACLFEGWTRNSDEAEALLDTGGLALRPAQDMQAVVPLADVL